MVCKINGKRENINIKEKNRTVFCFRTVNYYWNGFGYTVKTFGYEIQGGIGDELHIMLNISEHGTFS